MSILIQNGVVINGEGTKQINADVRVDKQHIVEIGQELKKKRNEEVIDATGLFVVPGFVDINCQSDLYGTLFVAPTQKSLLLQGITSVLIGNNGFSFAPLISPYQLDFYENSEQTIINWRSFGEYIQDLQQRKFGVNVGSLVGYSTLYNSVAKKQPSAQQDQDILYLAKKSIEQGAFGVSVNLNAVHVNTQQLTRMVDLASSTDTLYSTTLYDKQDFLYESFKELFSIAQKHDANIEFSHLQPQGEENQEQYEKTLELLEQDQETDAHFDVSPYTTVSHSLHDILPQWAQKKEPKELLGDKSLKDKLIHSLSQKKDALGLSVIGGGSAPLSWIGKEVGVIAQTQEKTVGQVIVDLLSIGGSNILLFTPLVDKKTLAQAIKHPYSFISTQGAGYDLDTHNLQDAVAHPSSFGTMQHFFQEYVFSKKILSLEEAVYKVCLGPAQKIGLHNRGKIEKNYYADIVLWDFQDISSPSEFKNPYQYSTGVQCVMVNGEVVYKKGENSIKCAGNILTKNGV